MSALDKLSAGVRRLLEAYLVGEGGIPPLKENPSLARSEEFTRDEIFNAVTVFMASLGLTTGNSAGRDLYALNELYLRDPGAREEINRILTALGRKPN